MTKRVNVITRVATLGMLIAASGAASATIGLAATPSTQTIVAGDQVTIDLLIEGLGAGLAPSLATYDLDVTFNPSVLSFVSATFGDSILGNQLDLFGLGNLSLLTPSTGTLNLFELSLDAAADVNAQQADAFVLASLRFSGFAFGASPISLSVNALGAADGTSLTASVSSASVVVTAPFSAPEPTTYALMLTGIALIRTTGRGVRA